MRFMVHVPWRRSCCQLPFWRCTLGAGLTQSGGPCAPQDFIWEVSLALSKAYDAAEKKMADSVGAASTSGKEALDALKKKIVGIYHPEGAEGEAALGGVEVCTACI